MEFKIITRGERLKEIRKALGLKQDHLSGKEVTRNLISMIETDKATLTEKAANVIYKNLKKIIQKNDMEDIVDIDEIFITEEEQVKAMSESFIANLDSVGVACEGDIQKIIQLLNRYNMKKEKAIVYYNIGWQYRRIGKNEVAYKYQFLANEFAGLIKENFPEKFKIICNLAALSTNETQYEDVEVTLAKHFEKYADEMDRLEKINLVINRCILLSRLGEEKKAIEIIEDYEFNNRRSIKEAEQWTSLFVIKGNCYRKIYQFRKSLSVYKKVLRDMSSKENLVKAKILVITNIIETMGILRMDSKVYIDQLIEMIEGYEDFQNVDVSEEVCCVLGDAFGYEEDYENAIKYYREGMKISIIKQNKEILSKCMMKLINIYIKNKDDAMIEDMKYEVYELIETGEISTSSKCVVTILDYYMSLNMFDKVESMMRFCRER